MKKLNKKGFTLIEVIVVAAIIAILAGILVPMIFSQIDESKVSKAKGDVKVLQTAVMMFQKDTGKWPMYSDTTTTDVTVLRSGGEIPDVTAATGWDETTNKVTHMDDHLVNNADATAKYGTLWKGPYVPNEPPADPWGNRYYINVGAFASVGAPVWIISAGPNGKIETNVDATTVNPTTDDIGIRLR